MPSLIEFGMSLAAAKASTFVRGTPLKATAPRPRVQRHAPSLAPRAKYGDADQFFDLNDLEDTVGSWDLYGQQDEKRQGVLFDLMGLSVTGLCLGILSCRMTFLSGPAHS